MPPGARRRCARAGDGLHASPLPPSRPVHSPSPPLPTLPLCFARSPLPPTPLPARPIRTPSCQAAALVETLGEHDVMADALHEISSDLSGTAFELNNSLLDRALGGRA